MGCVCVCVGGGGGGGIEDTLCIVSLLPLEVELIFNTVGSL